MQVLCHSYPISWLHLLTPVTDSGKHLGILRFAAGFGLWPPPFGASASAVQFGYASCPATRIIPDKNPQVFGGFSVHNDDEKWQLVSFDVSKVLGM